MVRRTIARRKIQLQHLVSFAPRSTVSEVVWKEYAKDINEGLNARKIIHQDSTYPRSG